MNKKLIVINGTMGVGKSSVSSKLSKKLENSILLDGDWCWMMNPWKVTEENIKMVEENITFLLNQFLENSTFDYIIFTWVMQEESIWQCLVKKLETEDTSVFRFSLMCESEELTRRMKGDRRSEEVINESLKRISIYENQDTIKIDTTNMEICDIVKEIKTKVC